MEVAMEIRDLRVYIAVVEAQGFTAAAHRLHMVQSSVSDVVARLERELGITLLERRGGTRPTAAGEALLRWARLLANCSERAVREVGSFQMLEPTSMRVGMLPTITPLVLPGFLGSLRVRYPRLSVTVQEALAPELLERVRLAAARRGRRILSCRGCARHRLDSRGRPTTASYGQCLSPVRRAPNGRPR